MNGLNNSTILIPAMESPEEILERKEAKKIPERFPFITRRLENGIYSQDL